MPGRAQERRLWRHRMGLEKVYLLGPFVLALIPLAILINTAIGLLGWPYDGLVWSLANGVVARVDPSGPGAGIMQPGDRIIELDDMPLDQVSHLYAGKRPGDPIIFIIRRGGEVCTVTLPLAVPTLGVTVSRLEPLAVAFIFWVIGVTILCFKPGDGTARLFFCFAQVACSTLVLGAISTTGMPWTSELFSLTLWLLGSLTLHLHLWFPRPVAVPGRRLILAILYGVAIGGGLLGLIGRASWMIPKLRYFAAHIAIRIHLAISFIAAVALLVYVYRQTRSAEEQLQIRLVIVGATLALTPIAILGLLPEGLWGQPLVPYEALFPFLLVIPMAYGYAIVRFRLISLDRTINRGLVYTFLILLLTTFCLVLNAQLRSLIPPALRPEPWGSTSLVLIVATAFVPLRDLLQRMIDWAFYGGWYNYRTAVQKVSQALGEVADVNELIRVLTDTMQATLKLTCACALLDGQDGNLYGQGMCPLYIAPEDRRLCLERDSPISQMLQREYYPVTSRHLRQGLAHTPLGPDEGRLLACPQTRLWVPLAERDRLMGILILGPKLGDEPFDAEDLQILDMVRRQTNITIHNMSLASELRQRATDMDRLHQQLLRAREEERKRLARELHDETIQSLVSLNYELSQLRAHAAPLQNERVAMLQQQLHQITNDLRKICSELRPPALDNLGLVCAVRSRLRELEAEGQLHLSLEIVGDEEITLPEEVQIGLFRVLQEALTNVQQHAQATKVTVKLAVYPTGIYLSIQDDGCGFVVPVKLDRLMDEGHFGLVGMRERLEALDGRLLLHSTPGSGVHLEAFVSLRTP